MIGSMDHEFAVTLLILAARRDSFTRKKDTKRESPVAHPISKVGKVMRSHPSLPILTLDQEVPSKQVERRRYVSREVSNDEIVLEVRGLAFPDRKTAYNVREQVRRERLKRIPLNFGIWTRFRKVVNKLLQKPRIEVMLRAVGQV